jgi:NADH-quinone oxidoreductase subunit A
MLGQYLPLAVLMVLSAVFVAGSLVTSRLLAPHRKTVAKLAPYESGIVPTREPPERFPVKFYLVAMIFIMFDVEIVFLFPYAVLHRDLGAFGLGAMLLFVGIFFVSFLYEIAMGGLDWGPINRARRLHPAVSPERTSETTIRRVGVEGRADEPVVAA